MIQQVGRHFNAGKREALSGVRMSYTGGRIALRSTVNSSIRIGGMSEQWARLVALIIGVCACPLQIPSVFSMS